MSAAGEAQVSQGHKMKKSQVDAQEYKHLRAVFSAVSRFDDEPSRANFEKMRTEYIEARLYFQRPLERESGDEIY